MRKENKYKHYQTMDIWHIMNNMRKRSRLRNMSMNVSVEYIKQIVHDFCEKNHYSWDSHSPFKPSIDRIDNSKPYEVGNIRVCWAIENYCKNIYSEEDVIKFCKMKLNL